MKLDDASNCGENNEYSNGNGPLMRILPIAYYIYYSRLSVGKIWTIISKQK